MPRLPPPACRRPRETRACGRRSTSGDTHASRGSRSTWDRRDSRGASRSASRSDQSPSRVKSSTRAGSTSTYLNRSRWRMRRASAPAVSSTASPLRATRMMSTDSEWSSRSRTSAQVSGRSSRIGRQARKSFVVLERPALLADDLPQTLDQPHDHALGAADGLVLVDRVVEGTPRHEELLDDARRLARIEADDELVRARPFTDRRGGDRPESTS